MIKNCKKFTFFVTYGNCNESSLVSLLVSSIIARLSCKVPVLLPLPCTVNVLCGRISMPGTTVRRRPVLGRLCFQHVNMMQINSNANIMPPNAIRPTSNTGKLHLKHQSISFLINFLLQKCSRLLEFNLKMKEKSKRLTFQIVLTLFASIPLEAIAKHFMHFAIFVDMLNAASMIIASITAHHFGGTHTARIQWILRHINKA